MSVIISKFVIKIYAIILYINKDGTTLFLQFDVFKSSAKIDRQRTLLPISRFNFGTEESDKAKQ